MLCNARFTGEIKVEEAISMSLLIKRTVVDWCKIEESISFQIKNQPIPVEVQVRPEIIIDQYFDLTKKELLYQLEMLGDPAEERRQKIVQYFFAMRASVKQIAEVMKIAPSVIYRDIDIYKKEVLKEVKKDLRTNKKILGHMVGLIYQIENQIATIWEKYRQLEADAYTLRTVIRESNTPELRQAQARNIVQAAKTVLSIHDRQTAYLDLLGKKTMNMLIIWDKFGLCGEDAIKLVLSGGIDVDVKIQQVRTIIRKMIMIVRTEVKDADLRKKVFTKLARDIDFGDSSMEGVSSGDSVDAEIT
jgi:hypothetical protein